MRTSRRLRRVFCAALAVVFVAGCVDQRAVPGSPAPRTPAPRKEPNRAQGGVDVQLGVRLSKAGSRQASEALRVNVGAYTHEYIDPLLWEQLFAELRVGRVLLDPAGIARKSTSLQDFKVKIREFDELVMRIVEAGGSATFVFSSMMPRWLSRDANNEKRLFTGPSEDKIWHNAPPRDLGQWSEFMKAFVHHFNRELPTRGRVAYNIGGEPDNYWVGTEAEFHAFYKASVRGAQAADPKVRIGGITPANPLSNKFTKARHKGRDGDFDTEFAAGNRPMIQNWIRYCARNGLPIHFVSWHEYPTPNPIPGATASPRLTSSLVSSWLRKNGYPNAELLVTDWPDWKSKVGENDGPFMAAYTATGVISFLQGGVATPVYIGVRDQKAYLDKAHAQSNLGFGGGTGLMTNEGVPKPVFNVYRLFSLMEGRLAIADGDDDFVTAVSSVTGNRVYVLVSNFVPTQRVLTPDAGLAIGLPAGDVQKIANYMRSVDPAKFRDGLMSGRTDVNGLPLPSEYRRRLGRYMKMARSLEQRRAQPAKVTLRVQDLPAGSWSYREYIVDDENANSYARRGELRGPMLKAAILRDSQGVRRAVKQHAEKTSVDANVSASRPVQVAGGAATITTTLRPLGVHMLVLERR